MIARTAKKLGARAAISVDRAIGLWAMRMSDHGRAVTMDAEGREAALKLSLPRYEAAFDLPRAAFFPAPAAPMVAEEPLGTRLGGPAVDLTWASRYEAFDPAVGERYRSCRHNRRAAARLFADPKHPRRTVIFLHGYLGGPHVIEERLWPIRWLRKRGVDVALCVLPHHGVRRPHGPGRPAFPDNDPRFTVEGFRQAVHDVRSLIAALMQRGVPGVGVMGMSLGGYTGALLSTVEPQLEFSVPMVPLASVAAFAKEQGRLVGTEQERLLQYVLLNRIYRVVSPLHGPVLVPPSGRLVLAASDDRICPITHAERIAEHWGVPVTKFFGAHLMQVGRRSGFREFGRMLGRIGWL